MDIQPKPHVDNPVLTAGPISKVILFWVWSFFKKGYEKNLTIEDIPDAPPEDTAQKNSYKLQRNWEDQKALDFPANAPENDKLLEMRNRRNNSRPIQNDTGCKTLRKALVSTFGYQYFMAWPLLVFVDCVIRVLQPWFLLLFVRSFLEEKPNITAQYLYAAGVCLSTITITLLYNPCQLYILRLGMRSRIALTSLVQKKMMGLKIVHLADSEVTTLITNDVGRLEQSLPFFPYLFIGPIQLIIFMYFLWQEFGVSSLAGVGFVILSLPFQYWNGSLSTQFRGAMGKETAERTRNLEETITWMNAIKMYTWENTFQKVIDKCRKEEVRQLSKRSRLHAFFMSIFLTSSRLVPFLTFLAFVLCGGLLTADKVFFSIAVFNTVTHFLGFFVLTAVRGVGETVGSLRRIQKFLLLDEKSLVDGYYTTTRPEASPSVTLNEATARWKDESPTLTDISTELKGNKLVIIIGPVGSGKSSLLQLILSELPLDSGECTINGKISYASQVAWIFDGSIEKNIVFNDDYDAQRYRKVVHAAGLQPDIEQLRRGDKTLAGEGGSALSGGQKARVNLARALYREAGIYLMDDPLSAVDSATSAHIFQKIRQWDGLRILVTHQHQYLPEADHIIFMKEGRICGQGTFPDLHSGNTEFREFVTTQEDSDVDSLQVGNAVQAEQAPMDGNNEEDIRDEETQATGSIGSGIYFKYFSSGGSRLLLGFHLTMFLISQLFITFIECWLAWWTDAAERLSLRLSLDSSSGSLRLSGEDYTAFNTTSKLAATAEEDTSYISYIKNLDQTVYLYVYSALIGAILVTNLAKSFGFFMYCLRICNNLHTQMIGSLMRAVPQFFHDNPKGRIVNYFTTDMLVLDEALPFSFFDMWTIFLQIATVLTLIFYANLYTIPPILIFLCTLFYVRRYYVTTSRDLKRIGNKARGPIITHASAARDGIVTIRAFDAGEVISNQFDSLQDIHTAAQFMTCATTRCFDIWVETLATLLLTFVAFIFLLTQNYSSMMFYGGEVGLAICSAMSLTNWLNYGMRTSADVENLMVSVERAVKYTKLPSEAPLKTSPSNNLPPTWPAQGTIKFDRVLMSYKDDCLHCGSQGKMVLKNLSDIEIQTGERIGIVGRTGAGKSSILWALFRMKELQSGTILIDGFSTKEVGLQDLRGNISIIPQNPAIFKGTLRFNLNPSDDKSITDSDMTQALQKVELRKSLEDEILSGGANYSVGQRQLVSLARVLLQNNKIIAMDEATANIDQRADAILQEAIRKAFKNSTVLTIAHRLGTVIDSDKIMVLDDGKVEEFDVPHILLQKENGKLKAMVEGTPNCEELKIRAFQAFKDKHGGQ